MTYKDGTIAGICNQYQQQPGGIDSIRDTDQLFSRVKSRMDHIQKVCAI
jgi:hypothetical protein